MKRSVLAIVIIALAVLTFLYLSFIGIQTVTIDKGIYPQGEEVIVRGTDFTLLGCSCGKHDFRFFQETESGWKLIRFRVRGFGDTLCVDGEPVGFPFPCDVQTCSLFYSMFKENQYIWNQKIFEESGTVKTCGQLDESMQRDSFTAFSSSNAPPGRYKIKFGSAEKVFEIK